MISTFHEYPLYSAENIRTFQDTYTYLYVRTGARYVYTGASEPFTKTCCCCARCCQPVITTQASKSQGSVRCAKLLLLWSIVASSMTTKLLLCLLLTTCYHDARKSQVEHNSSSSTTTTPIVRTGVPAILGHLMNLPRTPPAVPAVDNLLPRRNQIGRKDQFAVQSCYGVSSLLP